MNILDKTTIRLKEKDCEKFPLKETIKGINVTLWSIYLRRTVLLGKFSKIFSPEDCFKINQQQKNTKNANVRTKIATTVQFESFSNLAIRSKFLKISFGFTETSMIENFLPCRRKNASIYTWAFNAEHFQTQPVIHIFREITGKNGYQTTSF